MHLYALRLKSVVVLFLLLASPGCGQSFRLYLAAEAASGSRVVSLGFLADAGVYDDEATPCVQMGAKRLRAQYEVRSRWPDGSFRWLRVHFPLRLSAGGQCLAKLYPCGATKPPQLPPSTFSILARDGGFQCDNKQLCFDLNSDAGCVLKNIGLKRKRQPILESLSMGKGIEEAQVLLETSGPYLAVFRVQGEICSTDEGAMVTIDRRISLAFDQGEIEIETWFTPRPDVLPAGGIDLHFRLSHGVQRFRSKARAERLEAGDLPLILRVSPGGFEEFRHRGDTFEPFNDQLCLHSKSGRVSFGMVNFRELRPSLLELTTIREGRISCVSPNYHWYLGARPGRRIVVGLSGRKNKSKLLALHRPVVLPSGRRAWPQYHLKNPPPLAGLRGVAQPLLEQIQIELDVTQAHKRGFIWLGEENYGDWRWSQTDAGNLEYDTAWGLRAAAQYLADPTLLRQSRAAVGHLFQRDLSSTGLPLQHGAYHRQAGIEPGHMWLEGIMNETVLGGDAFLADSLEAMIEAWLSVAPRLTRRRLNTRSVAWSLQFASHLHRFGFEAETRPTIVGLLSKVVNAPGDAIPLFDRIPDSETLYQVAPWVNVGILGEAIFMAPNLAKKHACRSRFVRSAERILQCAWLGPKLGLAKSMTLSEASNEPLFVGGRATGEEALFFALGLVRAAQLGGPQSLLQAAREVCRWALGRQTIAKGRFSGMRLSQLLWVYPRLFVGG